METIMRLVSRFHNLALKHTQTQTHTHTPLLRWLVGLQSVVGETHQNKPVATRRNLFHPYVHLTGRRRCCDQKKARKRCGERLLLMWVWEAQCVVLSGHPPVCWMLTSVRMLVVCLSRPYSVWFLIQDSGQCFIVCVVVLSLCVGLELGWKCGTHMLLSPKRAPSWLLGLHYNLGVPRSTFPPNSTPGVTQWRH